MQGDGAEKEKREDGMERKSWVEGGKKKEKEREKERERCVYKNISFKPTPGLIEEEAEKPRITSPRKPGTPCTELS